MLVPREYGGDELSLPDALRVVETLSRADASTGWTVMIGSHGPLVLSFLPRTTFEQIYAAGPDVILGGALAPKGAAVPGEGGYRVSGRWPFASGCQHATWLVGNCMVLTDGQPELMPDGMPMMRLAVFPADQVARHDTWDVVGLRGTGSHDISVQDAWRPADWTCTLFGGRSILEGPTFSISLLAQLALYIAAVAVGIAAGAVDDVGQVARSGKRRSLAPRRLAASPMFQEHMGEADGALRAARALLYAEAAGAWEKVTAGAMLGLLDRAQLRAAGAHVVRLSVRAVDIAYTAGGGTSLYETFPLQRRFRDIHALTQHASVAGDVIPLVGALLAGESVDAMRI
jgi:alkylation response protein AidB-like acyl-CoA dehydrogenase